MGRGRREKWSTELSRVGTAEWTEVWTGWGQDVARLRLACGQGRWGQDGSKQQGLQWGTSPGPPAGCQAQRPLGPSSGVNDCRIAQEAVERGFSARGAISLKTHSGDTENWGSETELGRGHCSIPYTPHAPEGPLPLLEKGEATLGFRFGRG